MRMRSALLFSILVLIVLSCRAFPDEVLLKSGGRVQGDITSKDNSRIILQTAYGSVTLDAADILEVKYSSAAEKEVREQLKSLPPADVDTRLSLAAKASSAGLVDLSKSIYTQVIAVSPDDKTARQALGYTLYEGEWVTARDKAIHEGQVPFRGAWVTSEERDRLKKDEQSAEYFATFGLSPDEGKATAALVNDLDVTIEPRGGYIVRRHVQSLPVKDKPYIYSVDVLNWQRLGVFVGVTFLDSSQKRISGFGQLQYKVYETSADTLGSRKIGREILSQTLIIKPDMWLKKSDFKYWDTRISSTYERIVSDEARKAWSDNDVMNYDGILYILVNRDIDTLTPPGVYYVEATFTLLDRQKKVGRFVQYAELR